MPYPTKKRSKKRTYTHPRQGQLLDVSWRDYLPEDIGTIVLSALNAGRGVFIGVTPSQELLTMRVYHEHGYTPLYGRSLGELTGRLMKIRGIQRIIERSELLDGAAIPLDASERTVNPLVALWELPHELAERLSADHESRLAWMASQPPLKQRLATCRRSPPPLK